MTNDALYILTTTILYLEDFPGGPSGISALVVVLIDNLTHEVVAGAREHPGLEPVLDVIDVVEEDLVLPVDTAPTGVSADPPVGPRQVRPG